MKRLAPALVLVALLAAACSSKPESSVTPSKAPVSAGTTLDWHGCAGDLKVNKASQCTNLTVPLDRTGAIPGTISLQLVRRKATGKGKAIGSLLLNPGGPGAGTVGSFDYLYDGLNKSLRSSFDVVGWDPRGTGNSSPVHCVDGKTMDRLVAESPDTSTASGLAEVVADAKIYVDACETHSGKELPFVGTVDTAKDMDVIRAALGDAKTTYLGYSYGTELGYVYASLFPTKVRALVLDGALDPTLTPIQHGKSQSVGFQKALDAFLANCASDSGCDWKPGGDLHAAFRAYQAKLIADPADTGSASRPLTLTLFQTGVAAALYSREDWKYLQQGLQKLSKGDGSLMLALADSLNERHDDGTYDPIDDAFAAITCIDQPVPDGTRPWIDANNAVKAQLPDFSTRTALAPSGPGYACSLYKVRPAVSTIPATVTGAPPALIIGSTGDPATPFAEAQAMAKAYAGSVLLTRVGQGHTGYTASACVRADADAYLLHLTLPKVGTVCQS